MAKQCPVCWSFVAREFYFYENERCVDCQHAQNEINNPKRKTMSADTDLARIELVAERNMDNWFDLKEALANERVRQGLSMAELAHRMAVTEAYVLELERDEANPTVSTLRRWLGALGTSITYTLDFPNLKEGTN